MIWLLKDRDDWQETFLIFPTEIKNQLVWLETVERRWNPNKNFRCIDHYDPGEYDGGWDYRLKEPA